MRQNEFLKVGSSKNNIAVLSTSKDAPAPARRTITCTEQELIVDARPGMSRWATRLARSLGLPLHPNEIQSATDFGLCDAARRFNPCCGASFSTYSRHFIRGEILKLCRTQIAIQNHEQSAESERVDQSEDRGSAIDNVAASEITDSPSYHFELQEAASKIVDALASLTSIERTIFLNIHLHDEKVARVAKKLNYSRGHASEIRRVARMKLQQCLAEWEEPIAA